VKAKFPLYSKVLALAFLNLCLLGLALAVIVRVQFRLDPSSFLLAPAESRIIGAAHAVALELDEAEPATWGQVLARSAATHAVTIVLYDEAGERIAGPEIALPREVAERIPRGEKPPGDRPPPDRRQGEKKDAPKGRGHRPRSAPVFLTSTSAPTGYWAGVRVPLRSEDRQNPHPGTLLMMTPSLLASRLFFDVTPWIAIGLAVVLISVVCWLPFIRGMTHSIAQMTRAAEQIAEGRLEVQVADRRRDEIGQLGGAVNRMAARLSSFVNGQKAFLSGIAHELCTPIATIQFGLGSLERRVPPEQSDAVADIQEEVQHMSALVNELLSFSRAGIEALDVKLTAVNVAATVARVLDREASPETRIEVSVDEKLAVEAEPEYLFRALSNVVRNAIRYAGHAGPIQVSARPVEEMVYVTVADSGPGVPEASLEEIFAPFYRLDPARTQATGGLGLGLAIVRNCVETCRGAVRCRNRRPSGLEVEIRLHASG
jgi:two-component system sensor histidine kinase CpxA